MTTEAASVVIRFTGDTSNFDSALSRVEGDTRGFSRNFGANMQRAGAGVTRFGLAVTAITAPLTATFGFAINQSKDFESAFANVKKTVDGTDEELNNLRDTIRDMATDDENPLSALENAHIVLSDIAAIGGQLGVPIDALDEFTQQVGLLTVATDLTAESAGFMLGRFMALAGMPVEDIDNFASAMVEMGNNLPTTEAAIAGVLDEITAIGVQMKLQPAEILGWAGAFSALGVSPELARTALIKMNDAIAKTVKEGGPQLTELASIAGLSADEFARMWEEDPSQVLEDLVAGLGDLSADELMQFFEDFDLEELRVRNVWSQMALGADTVTQALDLQEKGWSDNNAAMTEASNKANTLEGDMNRMENQAKDTGITVGDILNPALRDMSKDLQPVLRDIQTFAEKNPEVISTVGMLAGGLTLLGIAGAGAGIIIGGLGTLVGPLTLLFQGLVGVVGGLGSIVLSTISLALSPLLITFGLIAGILVGGAGLIFGFQNMIDKIEELTGLDLSFLDGIAGKFDGIRNAIGDAVSELGEFIGLSGGGGGSGPQTATGLPGASGTQYNNNPGLQGFFDVVGQATGQATGGHLRAGQAYRVGEVGPELFIPDSNGYLANFSSLRNMTRGSGGGSGSNGVIVNGPINIYGVQDVEGLYNELEKVGQRRVGYSSRMKAHI